MTFDEQKQKDNSRLTLGKIERTPTKLIKTSMVDINVDLAKVMHTLESVPNRMNIMDNNSSMMSKTQFDVYKHMVKGNKKVPS